MIDDLRRRLAELSDGDLDEDGGRPEVRARKLLVVVAAVAFSMLLLELLLTRMYPFFLGDVSSFVAIPVAMFGLSIGALALHLDRRPPSLRAVPVLLPALTLAMLGAFFALFFLFDHVFGLTHHQLQSPPHDALKTACLSLLFVPPFALAGALLSIAFRQGASWVGGLYAADLAGSALACVVGPVVLHLTDLPVALCVPLWVLWLAHVAVFSRARGRVVGVGGAALVVLTGAASRQWVFVEHPDPDVLGVRYSDGHTVVEHAHRWNDISRVSLVSWEKAGEPTTWRVMHDEGVSNVVVVPWDPAVLAAPPPRDQVHGLPFELDRPPKSALVIFAGAGRDMMRLYTQAGGDLDVTGVEINGLVPELATRAGDPFRLREFYDLPNVHLVIDEGRSFLNRDERTWDLIFAGSNGAQTAVRTGHVRKFLDTAEATRSVLDHLNPDGLIVYYVQPWGSKLEVLKRLFEERGLPGLEASVIAIGARPESRPDSTDTLLVKPSGFTPGEVERIRAEALAEGLYVHKAPGSGPIRPLAKRIAAPPDPTIEVPTDDRPYERRLSLSGFTLLPTAKQFDSLAFSLDWIKIFTTLLFTTASGLTILALQSRRRTPARLPAWATGWFLISGLSYMFAEIGLMAKLELFLGNPLWSVAVVLAAFLLANAAGSALVGRLASRGTPLPPLAPPAMAIAVLPPTLWAVELAIGAWLGQPGLVKAAVAVALVGPLATVLGMFYPVGVGLVSRRGLGELVPVTFGLATVSAVIGSTLALVAMIDLGARAIVAGAGLGYAVLALGAAIGAARGAEET